MAVALRLMRFGKKGYPTYRVVVLDKRNKRDGEYIEKVGLYNPMAGKDQLQLNEERLTYWLNNGAVVSEGMKKLIKSRLPQSKAKTSTKAIPNPPKQKAEAAPAPVAEAAAPVAQEAPADTQTPAAEAPVEQAAEQPAEEATPTAETAPESAETASKE